MFSLIIKLVVVTVVCMPWSVMAQGLPTSASLVNITVLNGNLRCDGQGVIIDSKGIIATNKHIIGDKPDHIYVALPNGKTFEAEVIQNSKDQDDVSLIKVYTPSALPVMSLADSSQIEIGNPVLALAQKRSGEIIQVYREVATNRVAIMEVNIPLNSGDSGGAIINKDGSLVGLIMANHAEDHGKSYAIASNKIRQEYLKYKSLTSR
jgi:S1-C subfamily serine protease